MFFYIVVYLSALFLFLKAHQKLHSLEIVTYWLLGSYLFQNFSAVCYMNFKTITIPDPFRYSFMHFLNRVVLIPMLMITFLHFFRLVNSSLKKGFVMLIYLLLFLGLEWFGDTVGVLVHVRWRIWWSIAFWLLALSVLLGFMKVFRKILFKGSMES